MLVKQLPRDINLSKVKIKLPDNVLKMYKDYCGGETEMWIVGAMMGDFFLSPIPPEPKGRRRVFPMPELVEYSDILEWEVVEIFGLSDIMHIFDEEEFKKVKSNP